MLNLPRILAKGLIYSFLFNSPSDQGLSLLGVLLLLPLPFLLPVSLGSSPTPPTSPSPLPAPSVLAQDHASPLPWVKPAGHMHPCCICLACLNWPFDPPLSPTFHTYLRLITNFYFWFSKAHYSLNTRWSSFFFLSNYDFSKINFSSNNDDI